MKNSLNVKKLDHPILLMCDFLHQNAVVLKSLLQLNHKFHTNSLFFNIWTE